MKRLNNRQLWEKLNSEDPEDIKAAAIELNQRLPVSHEEAHVRDGFHYTPNYQTKTRRVGRKLNIAFPTTNDGNRRLDGEVELTKKEMSQLRKQGKLTCHADRLAVNLARSLLKPHQKARRHAEKATLQDILPSDYMTATKPGVKLADDIPMPTNAEKQALGIKGEYQFTSGKARKRTAKPEDRIAAKRRRNKHNQAPASVLLHSPLARKQAAMASTH